MRKASLLGPVLLFVALAALFGALGWVGMHSLAGLAPERAQMLRTVLGALVIAALALAALAAAQWARVAQRRLSEEDTGSAKAREEAEIERRKDEFLAILGHELRNPLAPIHMALHVLDSDSAPAETVARAREIMSEQVRLMTRIVEDVMDASRIALGKVRLEPAPVDLGELLRSAFDEARPAILEKGSRLELALPAQKVLVTLDARRTRQVLHHLLVNARRFTDPGGHIRLAGAADPGAVTLSVEDDGAGLTPLQIAHVFQPFAQADGARSHVDGGLGIGLTLARNLVELQGGTIEATSPGPGRGSAFKVRLPRSAF